MGRRPNQLIIDYFERGPKLEDASNRYQHTCKSCGEKFPKGRIDSLTNHLAKKCPALPPRDRQRVLLQLNEMPLPDSMGQPASATGAGAGAGAGTGTGTGAGGDAAANVIAGTSAMGQGGRKMSLPYAPSKQLSALETLAEVSRQHLDLSGKRLTAKPPAHANHANHTGFIDEFLVQDDRPDGCDMGSLSQAMDISNAPALPSMYQFNGPLHHSPTSSPHMGSMPLSNSASMSHMVPSLVMAASAANDLMPLTGGMTTDSDMTLSGNSMHNMSEKLFQSQDHGQWASLQPNSLDPMLQDHGKDHIMSQADRVHKITTHPRPIAMNPNTQTHFTTDFSMNQKPAKPKVRGRFSDSRRKEVQEVRKRGACIRCRMLKKPCSGENPCNTCQNVESARLWKQPCIRTRIAEEFSLYSAGLHTVLAYHATNQAKGQVRLNQTPGRIEATHFPDAATFVTFSPLKCQHPHAAQSTDIDPAILAALASSDLEMIDSDDDISGKLDLYIKKMGSCFHNREDSPFMEVTSRTALNMSRSNPDGLLAKVLELWNLTRLLTSRSLAWHISSNPSLAPTMAPSILNSADIEDAARIHITALTHQPSYDLIVSQLMGATEKRASSLARIVMNDLERRLLQRQQANPFETFLVAVILLSCVERMCWLFRTWEVQTAAAPSSNAELTQQSSSSKQDLASALELPSSPAAPVQNVPYPPLRNPRWPLDKSPAAFSQQGERFSDILNMLLKMRGVPPKPTPRSTDGVLSMWGDDVDEKVRDWYDDIAITCDRLDEKANARFLGADSREWELKYVGKVIRGD
ncbi:hypothetical protein IAQ61_006266 [Plenodomus lingam]|uniref:Zn(2)-C6 fungal-type domain-containing protein n=1 Tax=Leptosphaeria maculans (strain JN3 / isolate v23.1.3 / race Av1-4-5-6-7-8) TaxID=985895 RepID=E4ZLI4_LEPMJ|nr:hypothetical protein LEMA_P050490.1 [Plenodomus lingam JN3]KAH9870787.1 hypothetical protein IAQ61_006266 [Plenodomus lingam]CBX92343.1 hypothetical protein LEMA_P050490.1 [Plenodomus lingam JN3]